MINVTWLQAGAEPSQLTPLQPFGSTRTSPAGDSSAPVSVWGWIWWESSTQVCFPSAVEKCKHFRKSFFFFSSAMSEEEDYYYFFLIFIYLLVHCFEPLCTRMSPEDICKKSKRYPQLYHSEHIAPREVKRWGLVSRPWDGHPPNWDHPRLTSHVLTRPQPMGKEEICLGKRWLLEHGPPWQVMLQLVGSSEGCCYHRIYL